MMLRRLSDVMWSDDPSAIDSPAKRRRLLPEKVLYETPEEEQEGLRGMSDLDTAIIRTNTYEDLLQLIRDLKSDKYSVESSPLCIYRALSECGTSYLVMDLLKELKRLGADISARVELEEWGVEVPAWLMTTIKEEGCARYVQGKVKPNIVLLLYYLKMDGLIIERSDVKIAVDFLMETVLEETSMMENDAVAVLEVIYQRVDRKDKTYFLQVVKESVKDSDYQLVKEWIVRKSLVRMV